VKGIRSPGGLDRTSKGAGDKRDMGCARSGLPVLRRVYGLAGLGALALGCVLSGPSPRAAADGQRPSGFPPRSQATQGGELDPASLTRRLPRLRPLR